MAFNIITASSASVRTSLFTMVVAAAQESREATKVRASTSCEIIFPLQSLYISLELGLMRRGPPPCSEWRLLEVNGPLLSRTSLMTRHRPTCHILKNFELIINHRFTSFGAFEKQTKYVLGSFFRGEVKRNCFLGIFP